MRKCRHCGVKLQNDIEHCPLCDMQTEVTDSEFSEDYPYISRRPDRRMITRLITFCAVVLVGTVFLVDHLVPTGNPWGVIAAAGIVYVWVNCVNLLRHSPGVVSVILCQFIFGGALGLVVDHCTGFYGWSVDYVIPFLGAATSVVITVLIMVKPCKYRGYILYQFLCAILCAAALILRWTETVSFAWTFEVAAFVCVISFLTVAVLSKRRTGTEFRKRFHF